MKIRPMHVNALPDFEKARAQSGRIKTRVSAHGLKIRVIIKQERLRLTARPQRSIAPIFDRHGDDRRPQSSL